MGMDENRFATQRGRLLARTTDLREKEALAVAYAELGYSINGVSKNIDASESTVKEYLEKATALYGMEIALTINPDQELPEYDQVEPGYHRDLPEEEQQEWVKLVHRYKSKLPQEWANSVLKSASEDGVSSLTE
jgi:predicted transcriptional regulator